MANIPFTLYPLTSDFACSSHSLTWGGWGWGLQGLVPSSCAHCAGGSLWMRRSPGLGELSKGSGKIVECRESPRASSPPEMQAFVLN